MAEKVIAQAKRIKRKKIKKDHWKLQSTKLAIQN